MANSALRQRIADQVESLVAEHGQTATDAFAGQIHSFNKHFAEWCKAKDEYPNPLRWEGPDKLCCYYATLAVIHDTVKEKSPVSLAEGLDPQAGQLLLILVSKPDAKCPYGADGLDTALKYVRADIQAKAKPKDGQGEPIRSGDKAGDMNEQRHPDPLQDRAVQVDSLVHELPKNKNMAEFRNQDQKWYRMYEENPQVALKALPPREHSDGFNAINKNLALIYKALRMPEDPQPSHELIAAARYVGLTILHDTMLPGSKLINDGIWKKDEEWVGRFQESLKDESKMIAEIDSDFACVEAELRAGAKQPAAAVAPEPAVTGGGKAGNKQTDETKKTKDDSGKSPELSWQAQAIALLWERRDWSIEKVAKTVSKTRQALYAECDIKAAIKARRIQKQGPSTLPDGKKDDETGKIDAWR